MPDGKKKVNNTLRKPNLKALRVLFNGSLLCLKDYLNIKQNEKPRELCWDRPSYSKNYIISKYMTFF